MFLLFQEQTTRELEWPEELLLFASCNHQCYILWSFTEMFHAVKELKTIQVQERAVTLSKINKICQLTSPDHSSLKQICMQNLKEIWA